MLDWINLHPYWRVLQSSVALCRIAGGLGLLVLGTLIMFGVCTLVASEYWKSGPRWHGAAAGAVAGDAISHWLGHFPGTVAWFVAAPAATPDWLERARHSCVGTGQRHSAGAFCRADAPDHFAAVARIKLSTAPPRFSLANILSARLALGAGVHPARVVFWRISARGCGALPPRGDDRVAGCVLTLWGGPWGPACAWRFGLGLAPSVV